MRERITFLQRPEALVDPSSLKVTDTTLEGPSANVAREERITLALEELPSELQTLLGDARELHIRWISPAQSDAVAPLFSRLSPGLHVFYTPLKKEQQESADLCLFLKNYFGKHIDCISPDLSFTTLPSGRFTHSTVFQYHQPLEDLSALIAFATNNLCSTTTSACEERVKRLSNASSFDLSWDVISHALKVTALWPTQQQSLLVTGDPSSYRTEVGLLVPDAPSTIEPHELGVSGHLIVLGEKKEPSKTLFTFPSRHRHSDATFSAEFLQPTGLHPTLKLHVSSSKPPPNYQDGSCALLTYLTLPRQIFADRYQLGDELFLASKNLTALRYTSQPVDLEAPDYAVKTWGSAVLLELLSPPASNGDKPWTVEVPLHLRYLAPASGGYQTTGVPYPVVFWACAAEEGTKFPTNPFEKVNLGYDGLFGPRTVFWHVDPTPVNGMRLMNEIKVPVLDTDKSRWVNLGTAVVVLAGFLWVMWKLASVYLRMGYGPRAAQAVGDAKEKKRQ